MQIHAGLDRKPTQVADVNTPQHPLVSIITPVYNGEKYLAECIESVLNQTYDNWEYVIVNNCSSDDTLAIAQQYARDHERMRVHSNDQLLPIIQNWNHALRQASRESEYCKVVHADDWLFPQCIERMLEIAMSNPSVGIVGSYVLRGKKTVWGTGLPYSRTVVPGREVCRATLCAEYYVFGSPSSLLIRSGLIRKRRPFYNEDNTNADFESCFDVLQESDFGFVHQILSYSRIHDETQTATVGRSYNTHALEFIGVMKKYGPIYLSNTEYQRCLKRVVGNFYNILASSALRLREKDYWVYQRNGLARVGMPLSIPRLFSAICSKILSFMFSAKRWIGQQS